MTLNSRQLVKVNGIGYEVVVLVAEDVLQIEWNKEQNKNIY